jgi:DNA primase
MGFAPREVGLMRAYLNGLGFNDDRLLDAGLLVKREDEVEPRPRFRDRLMFPIHDTSGHTVGFGGRLIGPGEPKYLNSSESQAFSKGKLLYNLSSARSAIRKEERVILVEGYFDAVRLVDVGIESVVAPMGTALTESQAELLAKNAKTAFLLYDSDAPGQKASFRAADVLLARGVTVRMVVLPDGEDPDTFVAKFGRDAMEKLLTASLDVFDRKVQLLERGGWFADLQRKRRALDALMPTIRSTSDKITQDLYIARASAAAGVDRAVLVHELSAVPSGPGRMARARPAPALRERDPDAPPPLRLPGSYRGTSPESSAERDIVRVMLLHPSYIEEIIERIGRLDDDAGIHPEVETEDHHPRGALRDPVFRSIYDAIAERGAEVSVEQLAEALDETAVGVIDSLLAEPGAVIDPRATLDGALRLLKERMMQDRLGEIERMTPLASGAEKDALLKQSEVMRRELTALGGRSWRSVRRSE